MLNSHGILDMLAVAEYVLHMLYQNVKLLVVGVATVMEEIVIMIAVETTVTMIAITIVTMIAIQDQEGELNLILCCRQVLLALDR